MLVLVIDRYGCNLSEANIPRSVTACHSSPINRHLDEVCKVGGIASPVCCMAAHGTYKYSTYDAQDGDVGITNCDVHDDDGRCQIITYGTTLHNPYNNACCVEAVGPLAPISGGLCSFGRASTHIHV